MFCSKCGKENPARVPFCIHCGNHFNDGESNESQDAFGESKVHEQSQYSYKTAQVLAMIPIPGLHRFYIGSPATGIAQLISFPFIVGCVWWLFDNIRLLTNNFTDKDNRPLAGYSKTFAFFAFIVWVTVITNGVLNGNKESAETKVSERVAGGMPETRNESKKKVNTRAGNSRIEPTETKKQHKAPISSSAIWKYPETAQELKKAGFPKMLKRYGVEGVKKINHLMPEVAEFAALNPTMDRIVRVDVSDDRSSKNELVFYVDAENHNRLYISESDLVKKTRVYSNQELLRKLLPTHEEMCEFIIKKQLTYPSTYEKHVFDSISETQDYANVIRIAFSAKNAYNLEIDYVAIFWVNAQSEVVRQDIQEKD